jgi:hypothetical protein
MKLSRGLVVAGMFLTFGLQGHHAQARGPSTPEERAKVIELTRMLERDPLNENADATRQWLREWTIEVPEIRFHACNELLSHGLGENYPYSREINLQTILSGAVFTLEHQDKARDDVGAYILLIAAPIAQWIVFACAAYYVMIGAALHFLEPGYDPRYRFMSEYAWSAYGWLMTTTFFVLALALLTVALALRNLYGPSRSARVGFGLLVVGAAGICVAGLFRGFPLHDVGGAVGLPSVVMAALLLSCSFRRAPDWRPLFLITLLIALGMFTALLSMVIDVGMPGLQQRIFLSLVLLWLAIVAHRLVRVTVRPV